MTNQQIKFRAKRKDNGEWVEGYYVQNKDKSYIFEADWINKKHNLLGAAIEVIPSSVGLFTGKLDKNDKEIYEGDKIQDPTIDIGIVYWKDNVAGFYCRWGDGSDMPLNTGVATDKCEVIGNCTDNPKMAEKK